MRETSVFARHAKSGLAVVPARLRVCAECGALASGACETCAARQRRLAAIASLRACRWFRDGFLWLLVILGSLLAGVVLSAAAIEGGRLMIRLGLAAARILG